ncbi:TolC family protein [Aureibacter tunicatorum]|uniref:Outer membrane protein TolC n=1 Tax=Aureibacter tunicatorum TaxID=866807 RepID=A0AAE3XS41_9BACT|nr:TolC family protein [Aureibacter tunicatorum]MDR6240886.1 outer membrane protein TolC [Aureibacter tunicatorum]BDD03666.1 hypothetical protein AUTU_11490 [Aureibacter tunicatorum]
MRIYLSLFFAILLSSQLTYSQTKTVQNIGVIIDSQYNLNDETINILQGKSELFDSLSKCKIYRTIKIDNADAYNALETFKNFSNNPEVDIIIVFGEFSANYIAIQSKFQKPTICASILDPYLENITSQGAKHSNVYNMTCFNESGTTIEFNVKAFQKNISYKKLAVIINENAGQFIDFDKIQIDSASIQIINYNTITNNNFKLPAEVDACFIVNSKQNLTFQQRQQLFDQLNNSNIPSFSNTYEDLQLGALISNSLPPSMNMWNNTLAESIQKVIDRQNLNNFPFNLNEIPKPTINENTLHQLQLEIPILEQIQLGKINNQSPQATISILEAVEIAISDNLEYNNEKLTLESVAKDYELSLTRFAPVFEGSATHYFLDPKLARQSLGINSQFQLNGQIQLSQNLFSEYDLGQIKAQEFLLEGQVNSLKESKNQTVFQALNSYIDVLYSKATQEIYETNVTLSKQNLDLAKSRVQAGTSSRSEIYRWETSLANHSSQSVSAYQNTLYFIKQLNKTLNLPLNTDHILASVYEKNETYTLDIISDYFVTENQIKKLSEVLTLIAYDNSPTLKSIDQQIAAQERLIKSNKRQRYIPELYATAQAYHVFYRSGAAAEFPEEVKALGAEQVNDTWLANIELSIPLTGRGITKTTQKQKIQLNQLIQEREILLQNIFLSVQKSLYDLSKEYYNVQLTKEASESSENNYILVEKGYKSGKTPIINLLDAQQASLEAKLAYTRAKYGFILSQFFLQYTISYYPFLLESLDKQAFENKVQDLMVTTQ